MKGVNRDMLKCRSWLSLINGDIEGAQETLKELALEDANSVDSYFAAGVLMRVRGDHARAVHVHNSILEWENLDRGLARLVALELMEDYYAAGDFKCVEDNYHRAEHTERAAWLRASAVENQARYEEAAKLWEKMGGHGADAARCWLKLALGNRGENEADMVKFARKALKADENCTEARFELARHYLGRKKKQKAVDEASEIVRRDLVKSYEDMGKLEAFYYEAGEVDALHKLVFSRIAAKSSNQWIYVYAAGHFLKKENRDKSIEILDYYMKNHGYDTAVVRTYAEIIEEPVLLDVFSHDLYRCRECGERFNEDHELCPGCGGRDTLRKL
ncbi:hypothetical protein [Limisalsivibrio acetivorans]|uniref:hypothetical protein n=1 Tax=Limisalsivibrio acetivorans TaxID=1304888 RepID=UPI0003B74CA4|nr:hypothetical protein [Limisalsivibrio acetivorans]